MALGNIGSALAGLSTVIIAVAALIRSPGAVRVGLDAMGFPRASSSLPIAAHGLP